MACNKRRPPPTTPTPPTPSGESKHTYARPTPIPKIALSTEKLKTVVALEEARATPATRLAPRAAVPWSPSGLLVKSPTHGVVRDCPRLAEAYTIEVSDMVTVGSYILVREKKAIGS